jgi:hypothetical protein
MRIRPRLVLLEAALVDSRCEQVVYIAVVRLLVLIRKQMEIFANELCELLVHLSLCLKLDVYKVSEMMAMSYFSMTTIKKRAETPNMM